MLEVRLIGTFDIKCDGKPVTLSSRAAQSLFAYLILTAGASHRREKLAGMYWPDATEEKARASLRNELWRIRKALSHKSKVEYLLADDLSIAFDQASAYWLDVAGLRNVGDTASTDELINALSAYQRELLPGFYEDWIVLEREHLRMLYEQKMTRLLELLESEKRWHEILEWAERWISLEQGPEGAYRALIIAYDALGDRAKVASTYERCVQALRALDLEPSEQTRALAFKRTSKLKIPIPLTSFIGREKELQEVADLLSKSRLVTLTGSGGVGKTRLAIQVVAGVLDKFPDGVWVLDLAPLSDPALVPNTLAGLLGLHESGEWPITNLLINFFYSRTALVVFDNCEHVIESCAQLVHTLLASCQNLSMLATSRETLRVSGEIPYRVPSLEIPSVNIEFAINEISTVESVRLFTARAAVASPGFLIHSQNLHAVVQICQHLDGIPLAIELAAARVNMLTTEQILKRLVDRFNLLSVGVRTALPRHRTLRGMIDWSHDLLSEPERVLFRQLSVFGDGWTLKAAEHICADVSQNVDLNGEAVSKDGLLSTEVLNILTSLVDKSLLIADRKQGQETRYHFLETIRQYAQEKLQESGNANLIRDRHLGYFLRLAEKAEPHLFGAQQRHWRHRLEWELNNLRVALTWSLESDRIEAGLRMAGALAKFWINNGHLSEGRQWLEKMLMEGNTSPTIEQAKARDWASIISRYLGDTIQAKDLADSSVKLYSELGDKRGEGLALTNLGAALNLECNREEALKALEEALQLLRSSEDLWGTAHALLWLGDTWFRLEDSARAASHWEASLYLTRELGDSALLAWSLGGLADVACLRGDYERAIDMCKEALVLHQEQGNRSGPPYTLEVLGLAAAAQGQSQRAVRLWGAASAWREAVNQPFPSSYEDDYAPAIAHLRAQLGEEIYARVWSEGYGMSFELAIEYALGT